MQLEVTHYSKKTQTHQSSIPLSIQKESYSYDTSLFSYLDEPSSTSSIAKIPPLQTQKVPIPIKKGSVINIIV